MIAQSKTNKYFLLDLPQCIQALSEGLAEAGDEAQALIYAREAVAAALDLKAEQPVLPCQSAVEEVYMLTILDLAIRLLANGTPSLGLDHVAEVKEFYRTRSEKRNHAIFHYGTLGRH